MEHPINQSTSSAVVLGPFSEPNPNMTDSKLLLDELYKIFKEDHDQNEGELTCGTCASLILKLHKHVHENHHHTSINSRQTTTCKLRNYSERVQVVDSDFILPHEIPSKKPNNPCDVLPSKEHTVSTEFTTNELTKLKDNREPEPQVKIEKDEDLDITDHDYSELPETDYFDEMETTIEMKHCSTSTSTPPELVTTTNIDNNENTHKYPCRICENTCVTQSQLKLHFIDCHPGEKPHTCEYCEKTFSFTKSLKMHTRTHTGERPFQCEICEKRFTSKQILKGHKVIHDNKANPFICEVCGNKYKTKVGLYLHKEEKHTHTEDKPHKCSVCGKSFGGMNGFKSHMAVHLTHICEVCGKTCNSKDTLRLHMFLHTGEKSHVCEVCGKGFYTQNDLTKHNLTHTDEKSFTCSLCGKSFKYKPNLIIHTRTHTGEKPYECDICKMCFSSRGVLSNHKKSHGTATPYVCTLCNKGFKTSGCLLQHKGIHKKNGEL